MSCGLGYNEFLAITGILRFVHILCVLDNVNKLCFSLTTIEISIYLYIHLSVYKTCRVSV